MTNQQRMNHERVHTGEKPYQVVLKLKQNQKIYCAVLNINNTLVCLQDCSVMTISTRVSCSQGTDTVAGIGRYAGQYWPLIGWAGSHVAGLCALIGC